MKWYKWIVSHIFRIYLLFYNITFSSYHISLIKPPNAEENSMAKKATNMGKEKNDPHQPNKYRTNNISRIKENVIGEKRVRGPKKINKTKQRRPFELIP